ncbi:MAG: 4'-phosphopantetheinyl transferase superfamily protein [Candidatus Pedobacter colombiensis]|uniref:4'-phosphopantetheinyl transferase superfamily protein n=1 Tax=Candidatus Pedobacter colombiensis TaxID=3121371 RepID=A0AAJ5WAX9_9SPHI|nr:4'-phosphopantetheinyl transferase superfamily protein [Pedobacter sp.]WEK21232.1 MAG: 4'-phosphopantetheinyl transferase superfamily protein [Pedobacter sp.]
MKSFTDHPIIWQSYDNESLIDNTHTHLFKISIDDYDKIVDLYPAILRMDEIEKASRFRQVEDAKRYIIGKFFLRMILSKTLVVKPSDIIFSYTQNKKPYIASQHFNISHSGNYTIIAISPLPIGIDIEFVKSDFNYSPLLKECFTPLELRHIHNKIDFYTFWTRKEAVLKASGEGIIDNLHAIDCSESTVFRAGSNYKLISNQLNREHIISLAINILCFENKYWAF